MKLKSKKSALLLSFTSLLICFAMLAGSTFAWFTDTATTGVNQIKSGTLDVDIVDATDTTKSLDKQTLKWVRAKDGTGGTEIVDSAEILWEPGCTYQLQSFRIANKGNLALKYKIQITGIQGDAKLNEVIEWKINGAAIDLTEQSLAAATANGPTYSDAITISGYMKKEAGNEYQNLTIDGIAITVYATQLNSENDSFGPDYDKDATYYPVLDAAGLKDALVNGGNIKVDNDVDTGKDVMAVTKDTTLDMNGKTIKNTKDIWTGKGEDGNWSLISARNSANLTITGNGTFKAKKDDCYAVDVQDGSTVTIEDGTFIGNIHAVYVFEGTANIKGGFYAVQQKYPDANKADGFVLNCYDANRTNGTAKIIVTGGTFVNFNPADCWAEGEHTNFVAEDYSVISETKENGDKWYTVVKGKGASSEGELNTIISSATEPTTITLTAGTYELPSLENKDITIKGTKDTVIDMKGEDGTGVVNKAAAASFEGVTVEFANENYKGFQHTGKLTYKDCTIKGLQFLYADEVEFINCEFDSGEDYAIWTYGAKNVTFTDCKFYSKNNSKSILCYIEGTGNTFTRTFNNCEFVATGTADKSAIMINPSANAGTNTYTVNINNCTATGYAENGISGQTIVGVKETVKDAITVNINGTKVYTH